jgi:acylphosphatase
MGTDTEVARDVVVHGLVQGVWFRGSCAAEARARGVRGWVTNQYDGTVRAHFEGGAASVQAMVEWTRHGPRHAVVDRVEVTVVEPEGLVGFGIR